MQSKLSLLSENVTGEVALLTEAIWKEALGEVDAILEVPINLIKAKQVNMRVKNTNEFFVNVSASKFSKSMSLSI